MRPLSTKPITGNRFLDLYSDQWTGPRPGLVIEPGTFVGTASVEVHLNTQRDVDAFDMHGKTAMNVPVYDELGPAGRAEVLDQLDARRNHEGGPTFKILAQWPNVPSVAKPAAPSAPSAPSAPPATPPLKLADGREVGIDLGKGAASSASSAGTANGGAPPGDPKSDGAADAESKGDGGSNQQQTGDADANSAQTADTCST